MNSKNSSNKPTPNATPGDSPAGVNSSLCSSANWGKAIPFAKLPTVLNPAREIETLRHPGPSSLHFSTGQRTPTPGALSRTLSSPPKTSPKRRPWPEKFRFKNKPVSLDSTVIDLSISLFDWAHFRRFQYLATPFLGLLSGPR